MLTLLLLTTTQSRDGRGGLGLDMNKKQTLTEIKLGILKWVPAIIRGPLSVPRESPTKAVTGCLHCYLNLHNWSQIWERFYV